MKGHQNGLFADLSTAIELIAIQLRAAVGMGGLLGCIRTDGQQL